MSFDASLDCNNVNFDVGFLNLERLGHQRPDLPFIMEGSTSGLLNLQGGAVRNFLTSHPLAPVRTAETDTGVFAEQEPNLYD